MTEPESAPPRPTGRLLLGLAVTLAAVAMFTGYTLRQVKGLRTLQTDLVDRSRQESLRLLRIQSDLDGLALTFRDMARDEGRARGEHRAELRRLRVDLDDALRRQAEPHLSRSFAHLEETADEMLRQADMGHDEGARDLLRRSLLPQQAALAVAVSRLLVQNHEAEARAVQRIQAIYDTVERNLFTFVAALTAAILATSLSLISANRRLFARLESLSHQRQALAQQLIAVQEATLHSISRELHDEFGQVLTAIGAMLRRAEKKGIPPDSPLRAELQEAQEIAQETIERIRSLSRILHPTILEDYGLEKTLDWYVPTFARQAGLTVHYEKEGSGPPIRDQVAIHVYRILQEALNNVAKHSGSPVAWVRLRLSPDRLQLEVEDRGAGLPERTGEGLGLVAMRERAALLRGRVAWRGTEAGGTLVSLDVPLAQPHAA